MLANSDGQDLIKHLHGVMLLAMKAADFLGVSEELKEVIGLSAFIHDVGKCTNHFQNKTLSNNNDEAYPRHNEISWVYAALKAKRRSLFKKIGPQAVYWHHGTFLFNSQIEDRTTNTIRSEINSSDNERFVDIINNIDSIIKSFNFAFDISKYLEDEIDDIDLGVPKLYVEESGDFGNDPTNAQMFIVRSCVVYADHAVSKLSIEELDDLISGNVDYYFDINELNTDYNFVVPEGFDADRFNLQKEIVDNCERTTIVKAPAGFGKSIIGIMWGLKQKGQIYWVCPRNSVAETVYDNILEELKSFNVDVSVELFLTSERKKSTHNNKVLTSNIVVTNIDNLLSPMVTYKDSSRIFDINATNVVFDEYHEFVSDEALFGAFITYMRVRHCVCKETKTLLLSATPSIVNELWDSERNKTKILPDDQHHYPAQHSYKYQLSFGNEFVSNPVNESLTMYCSVSNTQDYYQDKYNIIVHSKFSDEDRRGIISKVMSIFGKSGSKDGKVISAPILQASMNISFRELYKSSESPESDIQTIGRINRWGEIKDTCSVHFLNLLSDRRERSAITTRYKTDLTRKWFEFLEANIKDQISLNQLYEIYNEFNIQYQNDIISFYNDKYQKSIEKLRVFFPKQRKESPVREDRRISSRTLRNFTPSRFIIVQDSDGKWFPSIFSVDDHELSSLIKMEDNKKKAESSKVKTVWENIQEIGDFDYFDLLDKYFGKKRKGKFSVDIHEIVKYASASWMPIPIWTKYYDKILGLINK